MFSCFPFKPYKTVRYAILADVLTLTYVRSHTEFGMPVMELNFQFFP